VGRVVRGNVEIPPVASMDIGEREKMTGSVSDYYIGLLYNFVDITVWDITVWSLWCIEIEQIAMMQQHCSFPGRHRRHPSHLL
jgi:hypothetical protein